MSINSYRTRNVGGFPEPTYQRYVGTGYDPSWNLYGRHEWLQGTQYTESYRTDKTFVGGREDELSSAAREEFTDVYRNGFTEANPRFDNGHPFLTTRTGWKLSHPAWTYGFMSSGLRREFKGPLVPNPSTGVFRFPEIPRLQSSEIARYGSEAISATAPTKSPVSLATFLGELVEGLPRIMGLGLLKNRAGIAHSAGSEYLNYAFGWAPLVSDVRTIAERLKKANEVIRQYERDSSRVVRRRYYFPTEVSQSTDWLNSPTTGTIQMPPGFIIDGNRDQIQRDRHIRKDTWFSGAYQYYLNSDEGIMGKLDEFEQKANHLLGIRLTPSVLWELTPWSWFADWLGNVGSVLTSAELLSSDGLVLRYGYLMRRTRQTDTFRCAPRLTLAGGLKCGPVTLTLSRDTKERVKATPYGFGLDTSGFNPKQWAILGALGLTKAPRIL